MRYAATIYVLLLSFGCTSVKVTPISSEHSPDRICLINNSAVIVAGFEEAVRGRIEYHGIKTELVEAGRVPSDCLYTMKYTALKNWDIGLYLHHAELYLLYDGREIARAVYRLRNKGGLALNKWASVESKMNPVVDQLLGRMGEPNSTPNSNT